MGIPEMQRDLHDPDHQPPMPFAAAEQYARTVMGWAQAPMPDNIVVARDISFGPHRLQRYNVFAPRGAINAPVLVFWHGGGWTNGYRDYTTFMAPHVVALGLVLVAPSYRLAPAFALPAAVDDALLLLADLRQRLPQWGGALNKVYLSGHSAGGHLAALTALRVTALARAGLPDDMIRGCLPISGIMDLHDPGPSPGSLEERVYTTVLRDCDPLQDTLLSPLYWTAGNRVPFLLTHGAEDSPRVIKSNRRLEAMLRMQDGWVARHQLAERDHFQSHTDLGDGAHPWYASVASMVAKT